jgi:hypothetical protein
MSNPVLQQQASDLRSKAPLAWKKVDAVLGLPAEKLFYNARLPESRVPIAARLIRALGAAAESANFVGNESPEHVAWRAKLGDIAALLTKVDGASGPATESALKERVAAALARTDLSGGQLALARQLTVPAEPKADAAFADALAAVQLFFAS